MKQNRRNKMHNGNHNDIYDNNNISNKNQLDLSLSNVKSDIGVVKKKKKTLGIRNIKKTSFTSNELLAFKEKYHYTKIKAQRNLQFSLYLIEEFSKMRLFIRLYLMY